MNTKEQQTAFYNDLTKLIARYEGEFDLTTAQAVGLLTMKCHEIMLVAFEDDDENSGEGR